jgi:hypothetical protein
VTAHTLSGLASGLEGSVAAWYGARSRAFDTNDPAVRVLARFGNAPLLSGWALGAEHVAGRPALVEVGVGRGSVVLFGFQPNYRGQSVATWPLLYRALLSTYIRTSTTGAVPPTPTDESFHEHHRDLSPLRPARDG